MSERSVPSGVMNERSVPHGAYAVVGLGRSGEAACRFLVKRLGDEVERLTAYDAADSPDLRARAEGLEALGVVCHLGAATVDVADVAVVSPGVRPDSPLMRSALDRCGEILGELELAYRVCRSPWVAVTGTNGKTTTTALVGHLLDAAAVPCEVVGNIGRPAISVVDDVGAASLMIAEVSSFQLRLTSRFHPRVAVLLNITPDHIDYHGSFEAYSADKARIFAAMGDGDVAVIDVDDAGSAAYADGVAASGVRVVRVSRTLQPAGGAYLRGGVLTVETDTGIVDLLHRDELRIRGDHNVSNALAAAAAALAAGADAGSVREGLRTFEPLAHRLEPVGVIDGVEYFNDSKATNPDSVLKALTAFDDRPIVLLLGGRNKGSSFAQLAAAAAARARAVVVFGEAKDEIAAAFDGLAGCPVHEAGGLREAVALARSLALAGDAVVLSPGCASFDEFTSYEHRGETFRGLVGAMGAGQ